MSKNIDQIYIDNPITNNAATDLMYFGQSPYSPADNAAMTYANFLAQLNIPALPVVVSNGGSGDASFTAYSVICAGTTSTDPLQNVSGVGTAGQVLTSNGAAALPTWQTSSATPPAIVFDLNATYFFPKLTETGTSFNFSGASGKVYACYLGYVAVTTTFNQVYINLTHNAGSTTNTSVGLLSSPAAPNGSGQTLTLLAQQAITINGAGVGVLTNSTPLNVSVPAGTYLWAAYSYQSTGSISPTTFDDFGRGFGQIFVGDYLSSGTTTFACSVTTYTAPSGASSPYTLGASVAPYLAIST